MTQGAINCGQLMARFQAAPEAVLAGMISARRLKGNALSCLNRCVLQNAGAEWAAPFIWLPLMPRHVSLVSADGCCNLACRMCGGSRGTLKYLRAAQLQNILDHIPTAELLTFVAGNSEPLLNPELPELLATAARENVNADIVSNGHLLSDRLIEVMVRTQRPTALNISLDAATPETYRRIRGADIAPVLDNLRRLRAARDAAGAAYPKLALLMVGMEDNIVELPQFVELAAKLGAFRAHVDHMRGDFTPGDFMRNPQWRTAAQTAARLATGLNLALQMPEDAATGHESDDSDRTTQSAPASSGAENPKTMEATHGAADTSGVKNQYCPWLSALHIELDGCIRPCCHVTRNLGNIFEAPLRANPVYMRARTGFMAGKIYPECLNVISCGYAQTLRQTSRRPELM